MDRGRVYQTLAYAVDPLTGTIGNALVGNTWYDPSGNAIQQIPEVAGKVVVARQNDRKEVADSLVSRGAKR